ncbi:HAD-IA family hydrolase [Spirochaeta cellobiosiphila]|uniref:HAD-IA family hydrolase n=1 Tax=Spirochaeta cellobiosiphila TaxID=504483 RepID=UPI0004166740|nr:HAD-IA family hydrolase [Spirochaeta cellobiosiphila]
MKYLLFDLDNTLYQGSWGFSEAINQRMNEFVANYLGVTIEEALVLRKENKRYGTTLEWLRKTKGLTDITSFFDAVHPKNIHKYLKRERNLTQMLSSLKLPMSILTNAPRDHALRVLDYLEITHCFEHIFDIEYNNLKGKPHISSYTKALDVAHYTIENTLFIDDHPKYLYPFQEMGGHVLLVDEYDNEYKKHPFPHINNIFDLPLYLRSL